MGSVLNGFGAMGAFVFLKPSDYRLCRQF